MAEPPDESDVLEIDPGLLEVDESGVRAVPLPPSRPPPPRPPVIPAIPPTKIPVESKRPATADWFNELAAELETNPAPPPAATQVLVLPTPPPTPIIKPDLARTSRAVAAHAALTAAPSATATDDERLVREAEALASTFPTRAALLHAYRARVAELAGDRALAEASLARAAAAAPDARFVAYTRRWLAGSAVDPAALLAATRAELPLAGDVGERVALLWQIAMLEPTEKSWRDIVELDRGDIGAWLALAGSAIERERWAVAVEAFEAAAAHTVDPIARGAFHASAAGLRQGDLGDEAGARGSLERAYEADPTSVAALAGLETIQLHAKAIGDHAKMVAIEAARVGELDPALGYHDRAGDLFWECLRDDDAAATAYEHAAALSPTDVVPLGKLASLYEQTGKHAKLVVVYERLLERITDPVRRGAVLLRLGGLYERLDSADDALRCYRGALAAVPTLAPAAQALARLYQAQGMWDEVAEVRLVEVNRLGDPALRAARYVAIAELVEANSKGKDRSVRVIALYERALALDPNQAAALDALDRIHRLNGNWDAIVTLHETQLAHAKHPMRVRALRLQLAALYHDRAGAPDKAAEQLRAVLATPPDPYPTLVALGRALAEAGKWVEHVAVLDDQASLLAAAARADASDQVELVATLYRIAMVVEARLADPARALAAYDRVLALQPRHELAVHATLRLHLNQARWEDVIASERRLLELTDRPEEAAIVCHRIALVAEDHLARPDEAIAAYETALVYLPSYRPARVALERLLRVGGKFERLAGLLLEQATDAATGVDKARLLCQAALVRELHAVGSSTPTAAKLYEDALALDANLPAALWGLERLKIAAGDWAGVIDILGRVLARAQHPRTRARLLVHIARIHEHRLGDTTRAAELYEEAIGVDPGPAIAFERLRVALGRPDADRGTWLVETARESNDVALASGLLRLRAALAPSAETYATAAKQGATPQVVDGLARYRTGPALAEALGLRARQIKDAPTRALLHTVAAMLQPGEAAMRACADALAAQPDFMPALEGKRRIAERANDWATAATTCAELATISRHPANKLDAFEAAAAIYSERLGDPARAIALYREALAVAPGRVATLDHAVALFERAGDWRGAANLIGEQVAHVDDATRADLLARRAQLLADRLGDGDSAIADLERALALRPDDPKLLGKQAELHESLKHWADAAAVYDKLGKLGDVASRRSALLAQARIWTTEVPDFIRAQRILDEANQLDPEDRTVELRLAEVACLAGDTRRGAELYANLGKRGPALARAHALLSHVALIRQLGEVATIEATAFDLAVEDAAVVPLFEEHFRANGELPAFVANSELALGKVAPTRGIALRVALGKIFSRELAAPEYAIPYLQAAVAAAPEQAQLRVALGSALAGKDDATAIAELRRALVIDPTEALAYRRLAEIAARQGREIAATILDTASALCGNDDALARAVAPMLFASPVPGALSADDALAMLVGQTRVPDLRRVVAMLDPYLHAIFPDGAELLAGAAPLPEKYPIAGVLRGIAAGLGVPDLALYWRERAEPMLCVTDPRAFVIAPEHVGEDASNRIRFDVAYALARLAGGSLLGHAIPADEVRALLLAFAERDAEDELGFKKRVASALPRRARKDLEKLCSEVVFDASHIKVWEAEERRRALGVGVVASGGLRAVAHAVCPDAYAAANPDARRAAIRANPMMLESLRFAITDACWSTVQRFYGRA